MRILTTTLAFIFAFLGLSAQNTAFNYQAVARDAGGSILGNQEIGLRLKLLQNGINETDGATVYAKYYAVTTNQFGLVNLEIDESDVIYGALSGLEWGGNEFYLQIEMDMNNTGDCNQLSGGENCKLMGATKMLPVPYATYAERAGSVDEGHWTDVDENTIQTQTGNIGIGTFDPKEKLDLRGGLFFAGDNSENEILNIPSLQSSSNDFFLFKPTTLEGAKSELRLYIEDDGDDRFSIFGNSCGGGACNDLSYSSLVATFLGNGKVGIGTDEPTGLFTISGSSRNNLTIKTEDNTLSQGIAFQNSASSYTWNIFRQNAGNYKADLVFTGHADAPQNNIEDLTPYLTLKTGGNVEINEGDIYIQDSTKGIILTDATTGECYRMKMDNGQLVSELLANCPE